MFTKQQLQKVEQKLNYSAPRISYPNLLKHFSALCKGQSFERSSMWFYTILSETFFKKFNYYIHNDEINDCLQSAYWIEEDDIVQQVNLIICENQSWFNHDNINILLYVGYKVRDYLIKEGVFDKYLPKKIQENTKYYEYEEKPSINFSLVSNPNLSNSLIDNHTLKDMSVYDRYMLYIICMFGKTYLNKPDLFKRSKTDIYSMFNKLKNIVQESR